MTFPARCILCGGPVVENWDTAKCVGWCGREQQEIESMDPAQRERNFRVVQRVLAIEQASTVEVKGDRL